MNSMSARVENTANRDPLSHLVGMMSDASGYITGQEAAGQRQVVESTMMPEDAPWDALTELGFVKGEAVHGDDMFVNATLPQGWSKRGTEHSMHSVVVDERGVERVGIFYKAAFYDRRASVHIKSVAGSIVGDVVYGEGPVTLPDYWDLLTDDERTDAIVAMDAEIAHDRDVIEEMPSLNRYSSYIERCEQFLRLARSGNAV